MKLRDYKGVIVVPWDFSDASLDVLKQVIDMVDEPSLIHVVHVAEPLSAEEYGVLWEYTEREKIRNSTDAFREKTRNDPQLKHVRFTAVFGKPAEQIIAFTRRQKAELVVMSSRGRTGFRKLFFGSVAEQVVCLANCSVFVLRECEPG